MTRRRYDGTDPAQRPLTPAERAAGTFARVRERQEREQRRLGRDPDAPTFGEVALGYRVWSLNVYRELAGWNAMEYVWRPGVNTADCRPRPSHVAPVRACGCGLYARHDLADVYVQEADVMQMASIAGVVGAVAGWGRLMVHADGWRAEHARILALAVPQNNPRLEAVLGDVARSYRVPLVRPEDLEREASLYAAPLPEKVRPAIEPYVPDPSFPGYSLANVFYGNNVRTWSASWSTPSSTGEGL